MCDGGLSTTAADPKPAREYAAIGGLRRASRSLGKLRSVAAAGRVLDEWKDSYLLLRPGRLTLICFFSQSRKKCRTTHPVVKALQCHETIKATRR